jgi:Tol biopolymer transport system component
MSLDGNNPDIWTYELSRDLPSRLTTVPDEDESPHWSADGQRIAWAGTRDGKRHVLVAASDGSGAEESLWTTDRHVHVTAWSRDGARLFLNVRSAAHGEDIWTYTFATKTAKVWLETSANEFGAAPSPNGRWVAYVSDESGRHEVYVRGDTGKRFQTSRDGGAEPIWSSDGRALFFRNLDGNQVYEVPIADRDVPVGAPQLVFTHAFSPVDRDWQYAVSPDSQRFLVIQAAQAERAGLIDVTLNAFSQATSGNVR